MIVRSLPSPYPGGGPPSSCSMASAEGVNPEPGHRLLTFGKPYFAHAIGRQLWGGSRSFLTRPLKGCFPPF